MVLYLEDNKITCIENNSIKLITPANCEIFAYLASLIGTEITDYDSYVIAYDVDDTEYNKYFEQAANAIPVRMAILRNLITHRYE